MCGICGIYNFGGGRPISDKILIGMSDALEHRGPDDSGVYINKNIAFAHRRLSIIDLENGRQPMANEDNTVWITYNGEIYNFMELKRQLSEKGHVFRTNCDTEVIIHAYEEFGTDCVLKFNGMFAFAIWDSRDKTLFLARDRLGIKPLYYIILDGNFIFASEIKGLLKHPLVKAEVEIKSVPEYLFCTSLLGSNTMFRNINTLPAGHLMVFKNGVKKVTEYWDLELKNTRVEELSFEQYKELISSILEDAVRMRLMSDVPFGSLLSGGLDSSIISALATKHVKQKLKTFSMEYSKNPGMGGQNSDTKYASLMAETFKTEHKEFIYEPEEYHRFHEKVTWHMEKPVELTAPSLYLLHNKLKKYVTVVLSGEGSDELFGGYFFFLQDLKDRQLNEFPWAPYYEEVSMLLNENIEKETGFRENVRSSLDTLLNKFKTDDFLNRVLYLFIKIYLLEMLERQDKTSMAWGVETRVPFLDHRLVESIVNIPSRYKIKDGSDKHILKESFRGFIPDEILDRKKKPFPIPVDPGSVIRQRNEASRLVQSGKSRIAGYFDKTKTDEFLHKRNKFRNIDNLAIFRTSYAMIALELWHKAFGV